MSLPLGKAKNVGENVVKYKELTAGRINKQRK
jgi:hypothetical protein